MKKLFISMLMIAGSSLFSSNHNVSLNPHLFVFDFHQELKNKEVCGTHFFSGSTLSYQYINPNIIYVGIEAFNAGSHACYLEGSTPYTGLAQLGVKAGIPFVHEKIRIIPTFGIHAFGITSRSDLARYSQYTSFFSLGMSGEYLFGETFSMGVNLNSFWLLSEDKEMVVLFGRLKVKDSTHATDFGGEAGIAFSWRLGQEKRFKLGIEPNFTRIPGGEMQNLYGTKILLGYNF
jgi:hypothetical protein